MFHILVHHYIRIPKDKSDERFQIFSFDFDEARRGEWKRNMNGPAISSLIEQMMEWKLDLANLLTVSLPNFFLNSFIST